VVDAGKPLPPVVIPLAIEREMEMSDTSKEGRAASVRLVQDAAHALTRAIAEAQKFKIDIDLEFEHDGAMDPEDERLLVVLACRRLRYIGVKGKYEEKF
jgi:hypothetical protein